jgi:hypothetical protein
LAAAAALVALLRLFGAATFRLTALAGLFAAPDARVMVLTLEIVRFRFEGFVTALFILARLVLLVLLALRTTRVFEVSLLLLTRLRALDEDAPFGARFDFGRALETAPVFFVFELVVFFDLLRATIVNLSTRKLSRARYKPVHEHCSRTVHEYVLFRTAS